MFQTDSDLQFSGEFKKLPMKSGLYTESECNDLINAGSSTMEDHVSDKIKAEYNIYDNAKDVNDLINAMSSKSAVVEETKGFGKDYSTWLDYEVYSLMEGSFDHRRNPRVKNESRKEKSTFVSIKQEVKASSKNEKKQKTTRLELFESLAISFKSSSS
jgi:hypothetical protein